jgi:Cytochrome P450
MSSPGTTCGASPGTRTWSPCCATRTRTPCARPSTWTSFPRTCCFISALITATTAEGDPALTYEEVVGVLNSMMVAGVETTAIFIPTLVRELLARPGLWRQVVADPSILPAVVDEGLRLWPPARGVRRTTTREVELGGVSIPAGADVFVLYVSANFDETVFADPGRLDPGRSNAERHLSFGKGVHFCIGRRWPGPRRSRRSGRCSSACRTCGSPATTWRNGCRT